MTNKIEYSLEEYDYVIGRDYMGDGSRYLILTKKKAKPFQGKKVIFTGVLSGYERKRAMELAVEMGATVVDSVKFSPKIHYVILGSNPGVKNQKLEYSLKNGAALITDKAFTEMVTKFERN